MRTYRLGLALATLALGIASAASTYKVTISSAAWVGGKQLQPGDYKVEIEGSQATIKSNDESVQVPIQTETAKEKYSTTSIRLGDVNGQKQLQEIRFGGTKTGIVFQSGSAAAAGGR